MSGSTRSGSDTTTVWRGRLSVTFSWAFLSRPFSPFRKTRLKGDTIPGCGEKRRQQGVRVKGSCIKLQQTSSWAVPWAPKASDTAWHWCWKGTAETAALQCPETERPVHFCSHCCMNPNQPRVGLGQVLELRIALSSGSQQQHTSKQLIL